MSVGQAIFEALAHPSAPACVTTDWLEANVSGYNRTAITNALVRLRRLGYVASTGTCNIKRCHSITAAGKAAWAEGDSIHKGPRHSHKGGGDVRSKAWKAMQIRRRFDADEIAMLIDSKVTAIRLYLKALERAQIITKINRPGVTRWLLTNDLGPLAPQWRRSRNTVYDPNSDKELPCL